MGNPTSSILANIYVDQIERMIINLDKNNHTAFWKKYVYDIFYLIIIPRDSYRPKHLN